MNNIINLNYRIITITVLLCCLHILTANSQFLSGTISLIEGIICIFILLKKEIDKFLFVVMIVAITNFDISFFVSGDFDIPVYSIVNMPVITGYFFFLISLIPLFILYSKTRFKWIKELRKNFKLYFIFRFAAISVIIGFFCGIISILIDDNGIREANYLKYFLNDCISLSIFSLYTIYFIYLVFTNSGFAAKLKTFLLSVLAGLIIASLLSIISTKRGIYGDKEIILMPLSFFYSTSICIFLFYKEYKSKITIFILAILSLVIQLTYPNALTGKSWLGILYIFFAILIILFQRKQKKALFSIIICFAVFLISMHVILENPNTEKNLSFSKLKQAFMLVSITNSDWYKYLPDSPKTRIEEILNTGTEYYKKPYYLITGKGYGGSIKDHRNTFGYYNEFAFSIDQYNHNTFTSMHETVAVIFLKFGLWGILSFVYIFYLGVANFLRTPWSVIGTLWFIFFVGYSFNLALFGIPALVLGLYESNKENV